MTIRPVIPKSWKRPVSATAILILVLVATVLSAGCGGWNGGRYVRDQDVRITKLNSDGVMEWTNVIDSGNYDFGLDFTQTPDGGFVVVGGTTKLACLNYPAAPDTPRLTKMSATGEALWTRDYPVHIVEVIPNRGGSISAVSDAGTILQLDSNGSVINEYDPEISLSASGIWKYNRSFAGLEDGVYLFPGPAIVRVNNPENLSWLKINRSAIDRIVSVAEISNTGGYLALVNDNAGAEILQLDSDGNVILANPVSLFYYTPKPKIYSTIHGFSIVLDIFGSFRGYVFDQNGTMTNNISISTRDAVIPSEDGGFTSIGITDPGDRITKVKYMPDGMIASENTTLCSAKGCPKLYGDIIHTSDGGYAIMSTVEKQTRC